MKIINLELADIIKSKKTFKLNLGGGNKPLKGFYSVDIVQLDNTDILADLNLPLDQIPSNSVSAIYSHHVLEHISNLQGLMQEIERITTKDAKIEITVPHFSNPLAYSDPTHVRFFGLYSFNYFCNTENQFGPRKVQDYYNSISFSVKRVRIEFYKKRSFIGKVIEKNLEKLINKSEKNLDFYERRLCYLLPSRQITFSLEKEKRPFTSLTKKATNQEEALY